MNIDNVIVLGAGASFDAGIPLLDGFIEKMRYFYWKRESPKGKLTENDIQVFIKAIDIINELDGYHGRASFDDRNLEDILSILAFNVIGGEKFGPLKLDQMIDAISRTIELSCNITHDGSLSKIQRSGNQIYRNFWQNLINIYNKDSIFPTIISLNYDLVLERSLLQTLITDEYPKREFDGVNIEYHYADMTFTFKQEDNNYQKHRYDGIERVRGIKLKECTFDELENPLNIELLKLHGSLNFPKSVSRKNPVLSTLISPVEKPFIIPPISNKSLSNKSELFWRVALDRIQSCKNLYIVGYSLPKTDIYFQFFLKSALGPNKDFNNIIVYNPELFLEKGRSQIQKRYEDCFPEQLRNRIEFRPYPNNSPQGSFKSFVQSLPNDGFFY